MDSPITEKAREISKDLENWMSNLPLKLRAIPVIHLAIPGSHDSMTSTISSDSRLAPDAEPILKRLRFLGPLLRTIMARWSKTQNFEATYQLQSGIRYFDLRVATKEGYEYPYFVHGLYADDVKGPLNDIKDFLESHPREIVILDCQHFYAFKQADHENFMQLLTSTFGHKLMPYTPHMEHLTLEYMTTQFRYQVIIIYRSDAARFGQPLLWPSANFPTPWPNTVSIPKLIEILDQGISNRPLNMGFVSQCILTPTTWFVCKNLFSNLKTKCVLPMEKSKFQWLAKQKPGPGGLNIVISDFVDFTDDRFQKEVIGLNAKLLTNDLFEHRVLPSELTPVDNSF